MTNKPQQTIPAWGPYSKTYLGFSHIPALSRPGAAYPLPLDVRQAARLDLVVHPLLHSSLQPMPNTTVAASCHPWQAGDGLDHIRYRWELGQGPSEQAYAEVDFHRLNDQRLLICTQFVNNTERNLDALLNYYLTMDLPYAQIGRVQLADGVTCVQGQDRVAVQFARPRPWDQQQPDAFPKAVFRDPAFTDGFGLGDRLAGDHVPELPLQPFGLEQGDSASFDLLNAPQPGMALGIRYRTVPRRGKGMSDFAREALGTAQAAPPPLTEVALALEGAAEGDIRLAPAETLQLQLFRPGEGGFRWQAGSLLRLIASGADSGMEIDCLLIGPEQAIRACRFEMESLKPAACQLSPHSEGIDIHYPLQQARYRLTPLDAVVRQRLIHSGCLEDAEPMRVSNPHFTFDDLEKPFSSSFPRKQSSPGLWINLVEPQLVIGPGQSLRRYALLKLLKEDEPAPTATPTTLMGHAFGRRVGESLKAQLPGMLAGLPALADALPLAPEPIRQGMNILRATLLQNVVYPIYTKQGWIAHFTPGKRWDSLYTWDSGFIALGLIKVNRGLAEYMLDLYLAALDDQEQAFVHHGSPVPVQFMALRELVAEAAPDEQLRLLGRYYPRLRRYYEFLLARTHGSTTARFKSGLLSTYDYFYSSSGMDDYPAQVETHLKGLARRVAPAITASQAMLAALTMRLLATRYRELSGDAALLNDQQVYQRDYARLQAALEAHAWDEHSGYYGFVLHDAQGQPTGLLRDEAGNNLNCGFDGVYPLVAGAGNAPHQERLIAHLQSGNELLTPYGLTAVSQQAPYFSLQGYWNGGIWYPHAWYFGRAMLDCGEGDFLHGLVARQLTGWSNQARDRWNSYEMLRLASGEGAWHTSFGGLTSPLLNWAHSLHQPGTLTTGLATLITEQQERGGGRMISLLSLSDPSKAQLWYVLPTPSEGAPASSAFLQQTEDGPARIQLIIGDPAPFRERLEGASPVPCSAAMRSDRLLQLRFG